MLRPKHTIIFLMLIVLLAAMPMAQDKEKIKNLAPSANGSGGFFTTYVADTIRPGEVSLSVAAHSFNRDPNVLNYTVFPVSFSIGLHERIEFFISGEAYKRVDADDIYEHKMYPSGLLLPNWALPGIPADTYSQLQRGFTGYFPAVGSNGQIGFYNDAPFMDTGFGEGTGDLTLGFKLNLMSERRGAPVSIAVQPMLRMPTTADKQSVLRGLTSGASDYGADLILTKNLGGGATLTGNIGGRFADTYKGIERQDYLNFGVGIDIPVPVADTEVHIIGELVKTHFLGDPMYTYQNIVCPMDAYAGLRWKAADWVTLSGAVNVHLLNAEGEGGGFEGSERLGYFAQLAFHRKINEVPVVDCSAAQTTVTEGDTVRITAKASDPDDETLTYTWKASGGTISGDDAVATLDTSGLEAGNYEVVVQVTDGDNVASCSADITVEKRKMPPTIVCNPSTVAVTELQSVVLTAQASDPNGDALTYGWEVDGSSVSNNSPEFEFGTAGRNIGNHTVKVTVTDVDDMSASCEFAVTINRRPNTPPTVELTLDKNEAFAGQMVNATAKATDKEDDPLTYAWAVDGTGESGTGTSLDVNTTGFTGGNHSVKVTATDDRGASGTDTKNFKVTEKIVIPLDKLRPDNKAKAQLDEIALKMQQTPELQAKLTGHTDDLGSEDGNMKFGLKRAESVESYLVKEHSIAEDRIETASAGEAEPVGDNTTTEGRKENRRVVVELYVP
ncbi:MAG: PKD domain-containing protein [Acidobacteriota bacterium]